MQDHKVVNYVPQIKLFLLVEKGKEFQKRVHHILEMRTTSKLNNLRIPMNTFWLSTTLFRYYMLDYRIGK